MGSAKYIVEWKGEVAAFRTDDQCSFVRPGDVQRCGSGSQNAQVLRNWLVVHDTDGTEVVRIEHNRWIHNDQILIGDAGPDRRVYRGFLQVVLPKCGADRTEREEIGAIMRWMSIMKTKNAFARIRQPPRTGSHWARSL